MNLNNTQEPKDPSRTDFAARIYKINKGQNSQPSYFTTIKKLETNRLAVKVDDALLLEISDQAFPTLIRKLRSNKANSMLGFTVPSIIGKVLPHKRDANFKLIAKSYNPPKSNKIKGNLNLGKIIPKKTIRDHHSYLFDLNKKVKGNRPLIYLNAVSLGHNTTRSSADCLNLSIVTTRHYLAKLKKKGYLSSRINTKNSFKQLNYSLTKKGEENLKFYQKIMENGT